MQGKMGVMNTLEEWMNKVCAELEIPAGMIDMKVVLDLARDAAHGVARPAAPLTAFLVGVAVGRGRPLRESAERVQGLVTQWPSASEAGR
jgi:Domain of unknown function (DUF6457)